MQSRPSDGVTVRGACQSREGAKSRSRPAELPRRTVRAVRRDILDVLRVLVADREQPPPPAGLLRSLTAALGADKAGRQGQDSFKSRRTASGMPQPRSDVPALRTSHLPVR